MRQQSGKGDGGQDGAGSQEPGSTGGSRIRSQEQEQSMSVMKVKENESIEQALRRFKKVCEKAGILTELRRREYYDKPSIRKKKKAAAARKRALKKIRRSAP